MKILETPHSDVFTLAPLFSLTHTERERRPVVCQELQDAYDDSFKAHRVRAALQPWLGPLEAAFPIK